MFPFEPRKYAEFEGVLIPLNRFSITLHLVAFTVLILGVFVVAFVKGRSRPSPPAAPRRVRRLCVDDDICASARWN
jgi:hypothetical protein